MAAEVSLLLILLLLCHPRTFAPVWDVFKSSTEKLASCHMELVRKLQELIKDVQKYVEEQAKAHKKVRKYKWNSVTSIK